MNKEANINKQVETVKEDLEKEKLTFLYKAIEDAQETIRLTDEKTGIILLLLTIFVSIMGTHLPDFANYFWNMTPQLQTIFISTAFLFIVCIGITILLMIMVIFPRSNPSEHVAIAYKPKGFFYLYDLNTNWKDYLMDRKEVIVKPSFEKYLLEFQEIADAQTLRKELIYELLKVSYIREIKLRRINNIRNWLLSLLTLSLILFCLHFIGLSFYMPGSYKNAAHFPEFILHLF